MTPVTHHKSGQKGQYTSPDSSILNMSSSSASDFVERLIASGLTILRNKRPVDSESNSEEPNKRSRATKAPDVKDNNDEGKAGHGEIWQPLDLGGGRPPVVYGKLIGMGPEDHGAWWRCKSKGCLANVPCADTADGRAIIINHLQEHRRALRGGIPGLKEVQPPSQNSIQFVHLKYSTCLVRARCADRRSRPIPDQIKGLVKVGQDIRNRELDNLTEITSAFVELGRIRESKLDLTAQGAAGKESEGGFGVQANASEEESNNGIEKGKSKGKQ
ncbi:hypothetical protein HOY80DRAFT_1072421 [Tuber brumale]|nr:hypothetical protein HOY80DRAFT_1072421 [Tuber brumale]